MGHEAIKLELICQFPFIFPRSEYKKRLRKAVLSKQTTIYYEVVNDEIYTSNTNKVALRQGNATNLYRYIN